MKTIEVTLGYVGATGNGESWTRVASKVEIETPTMTVTITAAGAVVVKTKGAKS